jgi:hypothetical protein
MLLRTESILSVYNPSIIFHLRRNVTGLSLKDLPTPVANLRPRFQDGTYLCKFEGQLERMVRPNL